MVGNRAPVVGAYVFGDGWPKCVVSPSCPVRDWLGLDDGRFVDGIVVPAIIISIALLPVQSWASARPNLLHAPCDKFKHSPRLRTRERTQLKLKLKRVSEPVRILPQDSLAKSLHSLKTQRSLLTGALSLVPRLSLSVSNSETTTTAAVRVEWRASQSAGCYMRSAAGSTSSHPLRPPPPALDATETRPRCRKDSSPIADRRLGLASRARTAPPPTSATGRSPPPRPPTGRISQQPQRTFNIRWPRPVQSNGTARSHSNTTHLAP